MSTPSTSQRIPAMAGGDLAEPVIVASHPTYEQAQHDVDRLSDEKFDVSRVRIVGHDLKSVEQVTGRMTKGKATLLGLGSGAWLGLLIGLLIGIFVPAIVWGELLLTSILIGAGWGLIFGFLGHLATGGRRDFSSIQGIQAARYDVKVERAYADEALRLLAR